MRNWHKLTQHMRSLRWNKNMTGWWFGCHEFYFPIYWVSNHLSKTRYISTYNWLVVWWNINFIFPLILGISSSQLTHIFQRGGPTTSQMKSLSQLSQRGKFPWENRFVINPIRPLTQVLSNSESLAWRTELGELRISVEMYIYIYIYINS